IYSILSGTLMFVTGHADSSYLFVHFFPLSHNVVWFITTYCLMLLVSPLLNLILQKIDRRLLTLFLGVVFFIVCVGKTVYPKSIFGLSNFGWICWFCYLYVLTGYLKSSQMKLSNRVLLLAFLIFYFIPPAWYWIFDHRSSNGFVQNLMVYGYDADFFYGQIATLPCVISSFSLFFIFLNLGAKDECNVEESGIARIIVFVGRYTLDVYILLSIVGTNGNLWWAEILDMEQYGSNHLLLIRVYGTCLCAFAAAVLIGFLRENIFRYIKKKLDDVRGKVYTKIV
ncbi:MAG: hypothetical protein VZR00_07470, partial [Lachnospiraceae bacterium]|nr:hypothetical protein [Lachnospiraceae bacterium]